MKISFSSFLLRIYLTSPNFFSLGRRGGSEGEAQMNRCTHPVQGSNSFTMNPAQLLQPVASFRETVHLISGLPLFLLPSTFPSIIVFSRESCLLLMHPKQGNLIFSFVRLFLPLFHAVLPSFPVQALYYCLVILKLERTFFSLFPPSAFQRHCSSEKSHFKFDSFRSYW